MQWQVEVDWWCFPLLPNFIHRDCDNPGIPCKESLLRCNHFCETMAPLDRMLMKITKKNCIDTEIFHSNLK